MKRVLVAYVLATLFFLMFAVFRRSGNMRRLFAASTSAFAGNAEPDRFAELRIADKDDSRGYGRPPPPAPMAMHSRVAGGLVEAARAGEGYAAFGLAKNGARIQKPMANDGLDHNYDGDDLTVPDMTSPAEKGDLSGESALPARARLWFPQTFLFDPLVVTDDHGHAAVDVKVPDRLTSWRVLALAHSRAGAQAGAVSQFLGTLPTYVDPVVPSDLRVGDDVKLPFVVVNTQATESALPLRIEADGATLSGAPTSVRIPGGGSEVETISLRADDPGSLVLHAVLGQSDDVTRVIHVTPLGHPVEVHRTGTLAATRELDTALPEDAEPKGAHARLLVYGGAFSLLRSELEHANGRGNEPAGNAYALLLAGEAPRLLRSLDATPDADALARMTEVAIQRVVHDARIPSPAVNVLMAEAAVAHPEDTVLARLGARLVEDLANEQHPDGTFGGNTSVQRMLVTTAESVRVLMAASDAPAAKSRARGATLRAEGAFERFLNQVSDPYTAATIAASGSASPHLLETLRTTIRDAAAADAEGTRRLTVPVGVLRADGEAPGEVEAAALAILALDPQTDAGLRADLGSVLLAGYQPDIGWGDGRTNLAALRAVMNLFKAPLPEQVAIRLEEDGHTVVEGTVDAHHRDMLALDGAIPSVAGLHHWTVTATPAVAGLGFALSVSGYEPWKSVKGEGGLALEITAPKQTHVGMPAEIGVSVGAPAGEPMTMRVPLPAGVQPVRSRLEELQAQGRIRGYAIEGSSVRIELAALLPGQTLAFEIKVIPTLAGHLHSGASSLALQKRPELASYVPPEVWDIR